MREELRRGPVRHRAVSYVSYFVSLIIDHQATTWRKLSSNSAGPRSNKAVDMWWAPALDQKQMLDGTVTYCCMFFFFYFYDKRKKEKKKNSSTVKLLKDSCLHSRSNENILTNHITNDKLQLLASFFFQLLRALLLRPQKLILLLHFWFRLIGLICLTFRQK
jgi:hypothetical protein